ncbi:MAG TPA: tetratricopeptide repeat protein [Bryobacteraceae bacterium]|nr:tetratricopeptide repeat protein [Bryobacteraceae bacterium]
MKSKRREARKVAPQAPASKTRAAAKARPSRLWWVLAGLAAVAAVFWAYSPNMNGPFLFDDTSLPYAVPALAAQSLSGWLNSQRPLLMGTYWMSARLSPDNTWWFHSINVLIHAITSGLVFFIVLRLLQWSAVEESRRNLLAGFAAFLFLLHPVQTEAVAYLNGRSESLSVMLAFAALTVFLYRRETAASWATALAVLALFGAALLAKEHIMVLPALFLLTDYWWNPGFSFQGIRRNWKLYATMILAGAVGLVFFWKLITGAATAGFGFQDFTWYQYFFTQCRALFVYIGLFFFPANLTADWDFAISRNLLDHGAIFGLAALVALAAAAWLLRRRAPLATYGFFVFLLLMAPTSSILPIKDPVAERRLYFAILGLLLIVIDLVARLKVDREILVAVAAAVLVAAAAVTHARAEVWNDAITLWQDTVRKAPDKVRPHFQLAMAYFNAQPQRCDLAVQEFQKTADLHPPDADLLLDWGLAYDCLNQLDQALLKLQQSAVMHPTAHVFSQIGMIFGKKEQWNDALQALAVAEKLDPTFSDTYVYRGVVHIKTNQALNAVQDFQRALQLDPANDRARQYLQVAVNQLRATTGK